MLYFIGKWLGSLDFLLNVNFGPDPLRNEANYSIKYDEMNNAVIHRGSWIILISWSQSNVYSPRFFGFDKRLRQ